MSELQMIYCLIAFILGWMVSRYIGNGFSVGGNRKCKKNNEEIYK